MDQCRLIAKGFQLVQDYSQRIGLTKPWGYKDLGLCIAFQHGVPDATIPLFYVDHNDWWPLVRQSLSRRQIFEGVAASLGGYRAEQLEDQGRLYRLFSAPSFMAELETNRSCLLVGGRGTGKTTLLKGLSLKRSVIPLRTEMRKR